MHFFRSGAGAADIAALDPNLIGYVQLCDVPLISKHSTYMDEALHERMVPGTGELPLLDILAALPPHLVLGLEVPQRPLAEAGIGPHERVARCVEATRNLCIDWRPTLLLVALYGIRPASRVHPHSQQSCGCHPSPPYKQGHRQMSEPARRSPMPCHPLRHALPRTSACKDRVPSLKNACEDRRSAAAAAEAPGPTGIGRSRAPLRSAIFTTPLSIHTVPTVPATRVMLAAGPHAPAVCCRIPSAPLASRKRST